MEQTTQEIFTDQIDDPQNPMRSEGNRDALFELAENIRENGLINPITVRPIQQHPERNCTPSMVPDVFVDGCDHFRYEVVAGHRRLAACRIAGIIKISSIVRDLTDEQAFSVMTAENLEREDVPLLDECRHYKTALERFGKSVQEIARAARRSVQYVESRLAIADMPDYMQQHLQSGVLKLGGALALAQITDDAMRRMWVEMAVRDGISVAQAEFWLQGWKMQQLPGGTQSEVPPGNFIPEAPSVTMFECAIDGKKYDARLCKSVVIYEGNLEIFAAIVSEFRKPPE